MSESAEPSAWIIEPTEADFQDAVVQRSHELPVVVDFWAPWCGPCRALGPLLENAARAGNGEFLLAKVNVDAQPGLAGAFGVQSIPAVFALRNGRVVDQFVGVLSPEQLRAWLASLQPSEAERLAASAKSLAAENPSAAVEQLRAAIGLEPQRVEYQIELARLLLQQGNTDESRQVIDALAARGFLEPEAQDIQAALELRSESSQAGGVQAVQVELDKSPGDRQLQLRLGVALAGEQRYDEALEQLLRLVQEDRHGTGEEAREAMVNIFRVLGSDDERTATWRRKLASALY